MNAHCIAAADALRCGARVEHPVALLLDCRQENEILATTIGDFIHVIKLRP
jgi:hypothetical protein